MNPNNKIRIGIIGVGERGRIAYGRILKTYEDVEITALVDKDSERLSLAAKEFGVRDEYIYTDSSDFFRQMEEEIIVDALVIATYDRGHFSDVMTAMDYNLDILLEKPISPNEEEVRAIAEKGKGYEKNIIVCHVLRYAPLYMKIKELLDDGVIGEIININHNENIGYYHFAHSFVRGNWRNEKESSPLILQKSCHDMDLLLYLTGKRPRNIAAYGSLSYFTRENQPRGASDRCMTCKYNESCIFSAVEFYKEGNKGHGWRNLIDPTLTEEGLREALENGPYGRCVWACDNDVCDHESIAIEFEDGLSAVFNLSAFSKEIHRNIKIQGTLGELIADDLTNEIIIKRFGKDDEIINMTNTKLNHGGGDKGIVDSFIRAIRGDKSEIRTDINESITSHLMCFAAEKSRKDQVKVDI